MSHRHQALKIKFKTWLEYSLTKDAAYCVLCFFVSNYSPGCPRSNTFTVEGYHNWDKIGEKVRAFLTYVRKNPNSPYQVAEQACRNLMNQHQHIGRMVSKQDSNQIENNR